jgi:hypothetical protein
MFVFLQCRDAHWHPRHPTAPHGTGRGSVAGAVWRPGPVCAPHRPGVPAFTCTALRHPFGCAPGVAQCRCRRDARDPYGSASVASLSKRIPHSRQSAGLTQIEKRLQPRRVSVGQPSAGDESLLPRHVALQRDAFFRRSSGEGVYSTNVVT